MVENENNNTLKTKGYHLEHNFGHGKQHLSSFLATLNILETAVSYPAGVIGCEISATSSALADP